MSPKLPRSVSAIGLLFGLLAGVLVANTPAPRHLPDPKAIADAAVRLSIPGRFRLVRSAAITPDGYVWLLARDFGMQYESGFWGYSVKGRSVTCQLVGPDGSTAGPNIVLSEQRGLEGASSGTFVHALPDRSVLVSCIYDPWGNAKLAFIDTSGVLTVSKKPPVFVLGMTGFVDGRGLIHISGQEGSGGDYLQVNTRAADMPTVRKLNYSDQFGPYATAPGSLRWSHGNGIRTGGVGFCDDRSGLLVVSSLVREDTFIALCRFDPATLDVKDSGSLRLRADLHHQVSGRSLEQSRIVPLGDGGYWLFAPVGLEGIRSESVLVYRLDKSLRPVRPSRQMTDTLLPFAKAPPGSRLSVSLHDDLSYPAHDSLNCWMNAGFTMDFIACGTDGRLYRTIEERKVHLTVSE